MLNLRKFNAANAINKSTGTKICHLMHVSVVAKSETIICLMLTHGLIVTQRAKLVFKYTVQVFILENKFPLNTKQN